MDDDDDDDVLKLSLSVLIATTAKKNVERDERLLGCVGCGHGFEIVHVLVATKYL